MGGVPDEPATDAVAEEEAEPKECPQGHGPMRLRTRWANAQSHPGRKGSHAQPLTEWFCPRCGRTAALD
jgi:hypothetical protein